MGSKNLNSFFKQQIKTYDIFFTFSSYEKVLALCEKSLSEFSLNLYVLRPPESAKTVFYESVSLSVCTMLEMFGNLENFYVTKVTEKLTIFDVFD